MREFIKHTKYVLTENPVTLVAFIMLIGIIFVGIFADVLVPYNPVASNTPHAFSPPNPEHWFGTDALGRDILSRVIMATRLDLWIDFSAVSLSFLIGAFIGGVAGYVGSWVDTLIGRAVDMLMAFPLFVLAMALVAALGNDVKNIIYATAIINLPFYIRLARAEVNIRRSLQYVDAAKVSGNSPLRILYKFLLPNTLPPLTVQISLNMGWAILNAAGLSFIGLGIKPPTAEWGIMVANGAGDIISGYWWTSLFPGLALSLTVFVFNLIGDGLRDIVDPRMRS